MAEKKNLEIYRGDSKTITINFSVNASMVKDGYVWFTMKNKKDDIDCTQSPNECVFQTSDQIVEILDGIVVIGYRAQIYLPPAETELFEVKTCVYDIQVVGDEDDPLNPGHPALVKTLVDGKFKTLKDVTIKTA